MKGYLFDTNIALLAVDTPRWWHETLDAVVLTPLMFNNEHVSAIYDLPLLHNDPFDRALIAQAMVEELTLVTTDREIPRYASEKLAVIG